MATRLIVVGPEEVIFARGLERAKLLVRMLSIPDARVQLAAAQVIEECADRVITVIEEISRREAERMGEDPPEPPYREP